MSSATGCLSVAEPSLSCSTPADWAFSQSLIALTYLSSELDSIYISLISRLASSMTSVSMQFFVPKIGDYRPSLIVIRIDQTEPPVWYSIFFSLLFAKFSSVISRSSLCDGHSNWLLTSWDPHIGNFLTRVNDCSALTNGFMNLFVNFWLAMKSSASLIRDPCSTFTSSFAYLKRCIVARSRFSAFSRACWFSYSRVP